MQQFMATERQAALEVRGMWQRANRGTGEDMDLMARVAVGTVRG
jgi:hypothetical protein